MPMLCAELSPRATVLVVEDEPLLRDSTGREGIVMYGRLRCCKAASIHDKAAERDIRDIRETHLWIRERFNSLAAASNPGLETTGN